jgi:hypothetical protein
MSRLGISEYFFGLLVDNPNMSGGPAVFFLSFLMLFYGCSGPSQPVELKYRAAGKTPKVLALYEGWFGLPKHLSVGYSSHDPQNIRNQIRRAKEMGISGFVVDWYGDREPFIDQSYALLQSAAAKEKFSVAMMYDETDQDTGATDEAIADFTLFHDTYLSPNAPGHQAYLTYDGRPVIFIFPHGGHTDWDKVRTLVNKWSPAPLIINENLPAQHPDAFDGFYPWINPGAKGWTGDGSNWGEQYLTDFYQTMGQKYPDRLIVGGVWAGFDDSKASWGLNRHISARCGQTFADTKDLSRKFFPADQIIPFVLIETWNDYEEGSAIEPGVPACTGQPVSGSVASGQDGVSTSTAKP